VYRKEQVCSVFACGCTFFVGIGAHYKHEDEVHIFRTSRGVPCRTGVQCFCMLMHIFRRHRCALQA
jgi:hypothetical protein